jgi:hypothetical protein
MSGLLTLLGITRAVAIEYTPFPHRIDLNDGFNLSITILFNSIDLIWMFRPRIQNLWF